MGERISLKWNNYSATLFRSLQNFQYKEHLCDSTIVCKENFYPVHRLLLSLCSEHFERIYEKATCKHPFIVICDIEPLHLEAILDFVYRGEVDISNDIIPHLLKAAEALKIKGLTQDKISSHTKVKKGVQQQKAKNRAQSSKYQTLDENVESRLPIILDPVLSVLNIDDSINLNDISRSPPPDDGTKKKLGTSERGEKRTVKPYLLPKKRFEPDDGAVSHIQLSKTVESNHISVNNYLMEDHYDDDSVPNITKINETKHVAETNCKCSSNLLHNDTTSQITIKSYSSVCREEFEQTPNTANDQIENDDVPYVELLENSMDENGDLESSSAITKKSILLSDEEYLKSTSCSNETISPSSIETDAQVLENEFQEELSTCQALEVDTEDGKSETSPDLLKSHNIRSVFFSSIGLKELVPEVELQDPIENCSLTNVGRQKCKLCPFVSTKRLLNIHESAHASRISYKCKFCSYLSVAVASILKHQKNCCKDKTRTSIKVPFDSKVVLKNKKKSFRMPLKSRRAKYKCNLCFFSSKSKSGRTKHKFTVHNNFRPANDITFKCRECPFSSNKKNSVYRHEKYHSSNEYFKCKTCSFSSAMEHKILRHELLHDGAKTKTPLRNKLQTDIVNSTTATKIYSCGHCKFTSVLKKIVSRHEKRHSKNNLRPGKKRSKNNLNALLCPYCSYVASSITYHKQHIMMHTGEKPYACDRPTCDFRTNFRAGLLNHRRICQAS